MRLAVLASGTGSNFVAIAESITAGTIDATLAVLFSNKPHAQVLTEASKRGIPTVSFSPSAFSSKGAYEAELLKVLQQYQVDLVVLAGYLVVLGAEILAAYPGKIINLHPSLLPDLPGLHSIERAYQLGYQATGVTVHYVDAGIDSGPVIAREVIPIQPTDTLDSLTAAVHQVEHRLYPQVIGQLVAEMKGANT